MTQLGYAVLGLVLGAALGAVVFGTWRRSASTPSTRVEAASRCRRRSFAGSPTPRPPARARPSTCVRISPAPGACWRRSPSARTSGGNATRSRGRSSAGSRPCSSAAPRRAGPARTCCASTSRSSRPGMLVTDLRVNGRVVEFGLLLPDGRRLPVDSKWSALAELEALEAADDPTSARRSRARSSVRSRSGRGRSRSTSTRRSPRRSRSPPSPMRRTRSFAGRTPTRSRAAWSSCRTRRRCRCSCSSTASRIGSATRTTRGRRSRRWCRCSTRWSSCSRTRSRARPRWSPTGPTSSARVSARPEDRSPAAERRRRVEPEPELALSRVLKAVPYGAGRLARWTSRRRS